MPCRFRHTHVVRGGAGSLCTSLAAFGAYANPENQLPEYGLGVNNHWQRALRGIARGSVNQLADAHVDVDVAPSRTGYMPPTFGCSRSRPN